MWYCGGTELHANALADEDQWIEHGPVNQRGHWSNSQSGYMPGLQARSPVGGVGEATTQSCFPLFLPSPLSKNK